MGSRGRSNDLSLDYKVYCGGLPADATSHELEDVFGRYGRLRKVWIARRPPGFAFIEFEDSRDAEDCARALDGTRICGVRARVEMSNGRRRGGGRNGGGGGGGGDYNRHKARSRSRSRSRSPRHSPQYYSRRSRSPRRGISRSASRSVSPRR